MIPLAKIFEEIAFKSLLGSSHRTIHPFHVTSQCDNFALSRNYSQSKDVYINEKENKQPTNEKKNDSVLLDKEIKEYLKPILPGKENYPSLIYWSEEYGIKKSKKAFKKLNKINGFEDLILKIFKVGKIPRNFSELLFYFKNRLLQKQIIKQSYLSHRVAVLKPDLAAAHFILYRGGSVKFKDKNWMNPIDAEKLLPTMYMPTYLVEGINAEGTNLIKEGLSNLTDLRYLKWLSFKGLESVNDWFMDWISKEYHETLEHLDISNCNNVTHRGLSCFYRFEKLKTLKVENVSDSPEFKVACLMLLEIFPYLQIEGINLEIPQKIEPLDQDEPKSIKEESEYLKKIVS